MTEGKHAGPLNPDKEREADILANYGIIQKNGEWVRESIPQPIIDIIQAKAQEVDEMVREIVYHQGMTVNVQWHQEHVDRIRERKEDKQQELRSLMDAIGMCGNHNCVKPRRHGALLCEDHIIENQQYIREHHHGGA